MGRMYSPAGRYAPSPSGDLHIGNLRTALAAWLDARASGRRFVLRIEDVDEQRSSRETARRQIEHLAALGIEWDGEPVYQQDRYALYEEALTRLPTFECYCTRKDIREATRAPHTPPHFYPGTCIGIQAPKEVGDRTPAVRYLGGGEATIYDDLHGTVTGPVDHCVLRRGGREPGWAYNLACVVDDLAQGVDRVVRGEDLLESSPTQAAIISALGAEPPTYCHLPLVVNAAGKRLAKRDGVTTLPDLLERHTLAEIVGYLGRSLGIEGATTAREMVAKYDPQRIPREPWVFDF
ncbi:glutamate--tRNA ligase family protein [Corynebacterium pyruviciproducens]|uniref:glutamate--tRNA ligase family protein n=1 Tax=Corynebacterium pyruviciproducens TaxID=598660 RepID=UPI0023F451BB|nr:glutamate--tRNA ligase family protein [Corynebacterium pyruviciproducens]